MKIYTKKGDSGSTFIYGGVQVHKSDPMLDLIGTLDELNCTLGVASNDSASDIRDYIKQLQCDLFEFGALLSKLPKQDLDKAYLTKVCKLYEKNIDLVDKKLPSLTNFILPGGCALAAHLHFARAVCRRAERCAAHINKSKIADLRLFLPVINRLSDWLFVLARYANEHYGVSDVVWYSKIQSLKY